MPAEEAKCLSSVGDTSVVRTVHPPRHQGSGVGRPARLKARNKAARGGSGCFRSAPSGFDSASQKPRPPTESPVLVTVPTSVWPSLVGTSGNVIKAITGESSARVHVPPRGSSASEPVRITAEEELHAIHALAAVAFVTGRALRQGHEASSPLLPVKLHFEADRYEGSCSCLLYRDRPEAVYLRAFPAGSSGSGSRQGLGELVAVITGWPAGAPHQQQEQPPSPEADAVRASMAGTCLSGHRAQAGPVCSPRQAAALKRQSHVDGALDDLAFELGSDLELSAFVLPAPRDLIPSGNILIGLGEGIQHLMLLTRKVLGPERTLSLEQYWQTFVGL